MLAEFRNIVDYNYEKRAAHWSCPSKKGGRGIRRYHLANEFLHPSCC
jgi:hypothetical protein